MPGQSGHNTTACPISRQFLSMDDLTTELSFDSQAMWVIDVLDLLFDMLLNGCLNSQVLANVRSSGAGIKCLHCKRYKPFCICLQTNVMPMISGLFVA